MPLAPSVRWLSDLQVHHALAPGDRCAFQAPLWKLVKGMSQNKTWQGKCIRCRVGELEEKREMKKGCGVMAKAGQWQSQPEELQETSWRGLSPDDPFSLASRWAPIPLALISFCVS